MKQNLQHTACIFTKSKYLCKSASPYIHSNYVTFLQHHSCPLKCCMLDSTEKNHQNDTQNWYAHEEADRSQSLPRKKQTIHKVFPERNRPFTKHSQEETGHSRKRHTKRDTPSSSFFIMSLTPARVVALYEIAFLLTVGNIPSFYRRRGIGTGSKQLYHKLFILSQ